MNQNANKKNFDFWYNILYNFFVSVRKWTGTEFDSVNGNCNGTYLNKLAIRRGYAFAFRNDVGEFFIAPAGKLEYNYMYLPKKAIITDPRITQRELIKTVGEDCVYVPLNSLGRPIDYIIKAYAQRLAMISDDLYMNSLFTRTELLFRAPDDTYANKIRRLIDDLICGKVGILIDDDFYKALLLDSESGNIKVLNNQVNYRGYEYSVQIAETLKEFYQLCGVTVNGANTMKKEHSVVAEVESGDVSTSVYQNFFTVETEKAVERVNDLFGTDIKIEYTGHSKNDEQTDEPIEEDEEVIDNE